MSRMVNSVRGPISSDELGAILAHEHFIFGFPGWYGDISFDGHDKTALIEQLKVIFSRVKKEYGLKTIVDATPNDCGRDVFLLRDIAEACDINILASTGYYHHAQGATGYWKYRDGNSKGNVEDEIYELFKRETQEGVNGSDIKCACIKLSSTGLVIDEYDMWFFKAAVRIAKEFPDVRIITHNGNEGAITQADFFLAEGVDPSHVQIGHICNDRNVENMKAVLDKGFYIAFDRFGLGLDGLPTDEERFANLINLVNSGYGDKILLSSDTINGFLGREQLYPDEFFDYVKNWHLTYIYDQALPRLKELGLSDADVKKLTIYNAAAFYG